MASITRSTASRALHLRILPRPSNLGESREILRLLSQFGEIEYFKNLKYDALSAPNTALVIFKEESAAAACSHKSPIRFRMGKAPAGEQTPPAPQSTSASTSSSTPALAESTVRGSYGLTQSRSMSTSSIPTPPSRPNQTPFQPPPPPVLESRIYQIASNPARAHFRDQINMGHYHGSFPIDTKSVPQKELSKAVPILGLSCVNWRAADKEWRIMRKQKEYEQSGPGRRRTLREIYDEGTAT